MKKLLINRSPAVPIIVLLIVHTLLWHWLMANDAAASLFSSGPKNSVVIFIGVLVFMASRMFLYLIAPGYVAALLVGKLMSCAGQSNTNE